MAKKILIYYSYFKTAHGGSEYRPLSFIAELQKQGCDITLALNRKSDIRHMIELMGIHIELSRMRVELVTPSAKLLGKLDAILPFYRTRRLKMLAKDADICISTLNMFDFGKPAHHFVYLLSRFGDNAFYNYAMGKPPLTGIANFRRILRKWIAEKILRPLLGVRSTRRIIADPREHIYPNSFYVERVMREFYGKFNSMVFYPPTIFEFSTRNVSRAPLRVLSIGRIVPEKKVLDIIDITERARLLSGTDLELHLAGKMEPETYAKQLCCLADKKPWIKLVGPLYGPEKEKFLLSGTFAVHARRDEEFGISVAEYIKAGLIPVVPDEGGSPEVVDSPELNYHDNDEAARILTRLISDAKFREEQRIRCAERAKIFSLDAYMKRQRALLEKILAQN